MPKERFHLLMADEALRVLNVLNGRVLFDAKDHLAYFLGAILPDAFFYDLPRFTLPPVGKCVHRYQGETGLELCKLLLEEDGKHLSTDLQAFILGITTHLVVDGFWHPFIYQYSDLNARFGGRIKLSTQSYHYWLENQLEAFWLPILGPGDEYNLILREFRKEPERYGKYIRYYRDFLMEVGCTKIPKEKRIRQCLFWQTSMLNMVAYSRHAKRQSRLFIHRIGHSPVAVPPHYSSRSFFRACHLLESQGIRNLCDGQLMIQAIQFLADRLNELPIPL